jgi:hypothetical protein
MNVQYIQNHDILFALFLVSRYVRFCFHTGSSAVPTWMTNDIEQFSLAVSIFSTL